MQRFIQKFFLLTILVSPLTSARVSSIYDVTEEKFSFSSAEGLESDKKIVRRGVLIKRAGAKANVLICHAFSLSKDDISLLHVMFHGYNSVAFDFRAHGEERDGQYCTLGRDESYDVLAAAQWIKKHPEIGDLPLIVYGFSMGAVAAILAQAREKKLFDAMILDCPFDSTDKLLERGIKQMRISLLGYEVPIPGASFIQSYAYNYYLQAVVRAFLKTFTKFDAGDIPMNLSPIYPEEAIKYVSIPTFFIGCINDDKAPEEAVLAVYEGAKGYKRCWIDTEGKRHYDTIFKQMHTYFYKVDRFIKQVLDGSYRKKKQSKIKKDGRYCILTAAKDLGTLVP